MTDKQDLLDEIQVGIDQATNKLDDGRIRDLDNENARLAYLARLDDLVTTKFNILRFGDDIDDSG